jgi:Xaa-Pro aminopeptidase
MTHFDETTVRARQDRAAQAFGSDAPVVIVGAGEHLSVPGGQDQSYPFVPHPEYYWLTGARRTGGVIAYHPDEGWTHFVRPASDMERLWEGEPEVPEGRDVAELPDWLSRLGDRSVAALGSLITGVEADPELSDAARHHLDAVRRPKDAAEITLLRRAVAATVVGHRKAREVIRPGVTEREIRIEIEAAMFRAGADGVGYGTIVGAGTNSAVLHFEPGERVVRAEDLILVDAGGAIAGYTADVTRTYSATDTFSDRRQAVYDIVLAAELAAIDVARADTEWHEVHRTAARVIAEGLVGLGVMKGAVDGLLESGAIALFLPHGIGHMLGLGVRDVGGRAAGRPAGRKSCGAAVRVDLPLEPDFLMTVEPGLYFVDALLDDPERRTRFGDSVDWDQVETWRHVGGVRIEDNVLIAASGPPDVLTAAIPK